MGASPYQKRVLNIFRETNELQPRKLLCGGRNGSSETGMLSDTIAISSVVQVIMPLWLRTG
jgi:hypothetical protein